MLGVHLSGSVCSWDADGYCAEQGLVIGKRLPVLVQTEELVEFAELDCFLAVARSTIRVLPAAAELNLTHKSWKVWMTPA